MTRHPRASMVCVAAGSRLSGTDVADRLALYADGTLEGTFAGYDQASYDIHIARHRIHRSPAPGLLRPRGTREWNGQPFSPGPRPRAPSAHR
ncbi:MAG: hypothetical protein MZV70_72905 [Desulfobacterales bacterium]|nr:hypothetical protein [Desulfobacterales bacterium]